MEILKADLVALVYTLLLIKCVFLLNQEDYRRTVTEIDEKEYISLKIIVSELRNQYVRFLSYRHPLICDSSFFNLTEMLSSASSTGNVTRHDPKEHRENQEASKQ